MRRVLVGLLVLVGLTTSCSTRGLPADGEVVSVGSLGFDPQAATTAWTALGEPGIGGRVTSIVFDPRDPEVLLGAGDMLGVARSHDRGQSWVHASGLTNVEMGTLTVHPTHAREVWAGSMGGPMVSRDSGLTWVPARAGFPESSPDAYSAPVEVVLVDPTNSERLVAFGGSQRRWRESNDGFGAVWASTDGGARWSHIADVVAGGNVTAAVFAPDGTLLASVMGVGVWRSIDGGQTWTPSFTGLPHGAVSDLGAGATGSVFAALSSIDGQSGGVYRSDDSGLSWSAAMEGLAGVVGADPTLSSNYGEIEVSQDGRTIVTSDLAYDHGVVYRSQDAGASWTVILDDRHAPRLTYASGVEGEALALSPTDPDVIVVANAETALRTDDGGRTWRDIGTQTRADGTATGRGWSGLVAEAAVFDPTDPNLVYLGGMDGGALLRSRDGGRSWDRPLVDWDPFGGSGALASGPDATVLVALGQNGTFNGVAIGRAGRFEVVVGNGLPERSAAAGPTGAAIDPTSADRFAVAVGGVVFLSTDGGAAWAPVPGADDAISASFGPAGELWATTLRGVAHLGAEGLTVMVGSPRSGTTITVGERVLVAVPEGEDSGVWALSGETWTLLASAAGIATIAVDPSDPDLLAFGVDDQPYHDANRATGVWLSRDGGTTWVQLDGLPLPRVAVVAFDPHHPGRLLAGTTGAGFWVRQV